MTGAELPSEEDFDSAVDVLRRDYNGYRNSLGVRLLAFFGLLFTLFQGVQSSTKLSEVFPNLTIIELNITAFGINLLTLGKLMLFAFMVMTILFFAFRTFFKFVLTSKYIMDLYWIKRDDFSRIKSPEYKQTVFQEKRWCIHLATLLSLKNKKDKLDGFEKTKMWGIIPYAYFMPKSDTERRGDLLCLFLAIIATLALISVMW